MAHSHFFKHLVSRPRQVWRRLGSHNELKRTFLRKVGVWPKFRKMAVMDSAGRLSDYPGIPTAFSGGVQTCLKNFVFGHGAQKPLPGPV